MGFPEACTLEAFAALAFLCGAVVRGPLLGGLSRLMVGFETLEAATKNSEGDPFLTVFPCRKSPVVLM